MFLINISRFFFISLNPSFLLWIFSLISALSSLLLFLYSFHFYWFFVILAVFFIFIDFLAIHFWIILFSEIFIFFINQNVFILKYIRLFIYFFKSSNGQQIFCLWKSKLIQKVKQQWFRKFVIRYIFDSLRRKHLMRFFYFSWKWKWKKIIEYLQELFSWPLFSLKSSIFFFRLKISLFDWYSTKIER